MHCSFGKKLIAILCQENNFVREYYQAILFLRGFALFPKNLHLVLNSQYSCSR